jgi:hypothetical protein
MNTVKNARGTILDAFKAVGLEVNADKTPSSDDEIITQRHLREYAIRLLIGNGT